MVWQDETNWKMYVSGEEVKRLDARIEEVMQLVCTALNLSQKTIALMQQNIDRQVKLIELIRAPSIQPPRIAPVRVLGHQVRK